MKKTQRHTWIITEGIAGTENQCIGVAEALGVKPVIKRIGLRQPWRTLSPWLGFECPATFDQVLEPPWPDLLITSGRKAIAAARYIKKKTGGETFTLHIQDPRIHSKHFDLVAVPAHDPTRGDNVIVTVAAPNRITPACLEQAKKDFPAFEHIPTPRVAVLIGGDSKAHKLTPTIMRTLAEQLKNLNAGLMITTSRRTGEENERILQEALISNRHPVGAPTGAGIPASAETSFGIQEGEQLRGSHMDPRRISSATQNRGGELYLWDGTGPNPYFALLAWADYILVTGDSASMLSEAATTGKPVYMIKLDGGGRRIDKLHENLKAHGAVRIFDGALDKWTYEPLNDAQKIAKTVKSQMGADYFNHQDTKTRR